MTYVVDDFNRADDATLGANYAAHWDGETSHAVVSGAAVNASNGGNRGNRRTAETFAADQWAEVELSASLPASYGFAVILRGNAGGFGDGNVGYYVRAFGANAWQIYLHHFGSLSLLASGTLPSGTWDAGDTLRGQIVGSTIYCYRNGALLGSVTDGTIATGKPGIWSSTNGDTDIGITSATFADEGAATLTGTAADTIDEADIVAGGKTVILTVDGDAFVPANGTPTFSAASTTGTTAAVGRTGNGDITWAWPTSYTPTAGHFAVALLYSDQGSGSQPSGWTQITGSPWGAGTEKLQAFTRVLTGGDSAPTSTISGSGTNVSHCAGMLIYTGVGSIGAIGTASNGTGTPMTAAEITTTDANSIVLALCGRGDNEAASAQTFGGSGTGVAERLDSGTSEGNDSQVSAYDKTFASASSASGAGSATTSATDPWVSVLIELVRSTPFANARSAIASGLDSAQSEAGGWDAKVKPNIPVGNVVRTSDTVCTITLQAQSDYDITAQETITATIPAAALLGSSAIVAAPTFTVDPAAGGGISADLVVTDDSDTLAAASANAIAASLAVTDGVDALAAAAANAVAATLGATDADDAFAGAATNAGTADLVAADDDDTLAAAAAAAIAASLAVTDADDSLAAAATNAVAATLGVTDGADTLSAAATLPVTATLGVTDADDALAAAAAVAIAATLGVTDDDDTFAGDVLPAGASLSVTDDDDTFAASATAAIAADLTASDDADTLAAVATNAIAATLGVTDDDDVFVGDAPSGTNVELDVIDADDTFAGAATAAIAADLTATDGADALAAAATVAIAATLGVADDDDTFAGTVLPPGASLAVTDDDDTFAGQATNAIRATLSVFDDADTFAGAATAAILASLGVTDDDDEFDGAAAGAIAASLDATDDDDTFAGQAGEAPPLVDIPGTACVDVFAPWRAYASAKAANVATAQARAVRACDC